jgi:simple sugar transport system permease protein
MSLAGSLCCMLLAGFGVTHVRGPEGLQMPIWVGAVAGIAIAGLVGLFNGFLVAKMKIQPMVATLIFFTAGRAIGLLLTNNKMVYVHLDEFKVFGGKLWIFPTPTLIAAACILIMALILKTTSLGMYVQSVGINPKASRIAGINSVAIILLCYVICGLFSGVAGIVATSRIYSADSNNIGLNLELDAILAVALGGNSLGGGRFSLAGSVIGAYTIQAITTTMYALGVAKAQAPVYKAIIVILIVVVQSPAVKAYFAHRKAQKEGSLAAAGRV